MIVDTSAIISLIQSESDAPIIAKALAKADCLRISTGTYLETCVVLLRYKDPSLFSRFDNLLVDEGFIIEPVTVEQARIARDAYRDYGKGSGHRAQLNFGDCFSYALARVTREPILYKGDDFKHTDLRSAL